MLPFFPTSSDIFRHALKNNFVGILSPNRQGRRSTQSNWGDQACNPADKKFAVAKLSKCQNEKLSKCQNEKKTFKIPNWKLNPLFASSDILIAPLVFAIWTMFRNASGLNRILTGGGLQDFYSINRIFTGGGLQDFYRINRIFTGKGFQD